MSTLRWTIGRKLAALALVGLTLATVVGGVAFVNVGQIGTLTQQRATLVSADQQLRLLNTVESDIIVAKRDALLSFDAKSAAAAQQAYATQAQLATQDWAALDALTLPGDLRGRLQQLKTSYLAWVDQAKTQQAELAAAKPGTQQALDLLAAQRPASDAIGSQIDAARTLLAGRVDQAGKDLNAKIATVKLVVALTLLVGAIVLIVVARAISSRITGPISVMVGALKSLAAKDLTRTVSITSRDEVGDMAESLNTALVSVREAVGTLADSATTLAAASEELGAVSTQLGQAAEETSSQTDLVSASAEQVAGSVGSMSAATEEMTASIGEIANQATRASEVASEAVGTARETSEAVQELDRASLEIGEIVKVITSIAEQTNLLALNATIEAARAGAAGKGFAVVASEVKVLAQETAQATDDITSKISGIQQTTRRATDAIGRISTVIGQINENQTTIAAAVEEQTATTAEISRNVNEVSAGSSHIAGTIRNIATSAADTSSGAAATQQSAQELSSLAQNVQTLVSAFTY